MRKEHWENKREWWESSVKYSHCQEINTTDMTFKLIREDVIIRMKETVIIRTIQLLIRPLLLILKDNSVISFQWVPMAKYELNKRWPSLASTDSGRWFHPTSSTWYSWNIQVYACIDFIVLFIVDTWKVWSHNLDR